MRSPDMTLKAMGERKQQQAESGACGHDHGSGSFLNFNSTATAASAISSVGRSATERRPSTMTDPAIVPIAAAVAHRQKRRRPHACVLLEVRCRK